MYGHGSEPVHITLPGHHRCSRSSRATPCSPSSSTARSSWRSPRTSSATRSSRSSSTSTWSSCTRARRSPSTSTCTSRARPPPRPSSPPTTPACSSRSLATDIPESITVSVEGLKAGTQILAGEVELPEGADPGHRRRGAGRQRHRAGLRRGPRGRARRGRGRGRHRARGARARRPRGRRRRGRRRGREGLRRGLTRLGPAARCTTRQGPVRTDRALSASPGATAYWSGERLRDPGSSSGWATPARRYAGNRHNVGAMVVDELARRHGSQLRTHKARARRRRRCGSAPVPGGIPGPGRPSSPCPRRT